MRSKPRIGWVRHNFLPPSETFIFNALNAVREVVDVDVLAINRKSEGKFPTDGVTSLAGGAHGALTAARYWLTGHSRTQRRWAEGVSLLHAHMGYTGVHALRTARALGLPLVTSYYGRDVTLGNARARFAPQYLPYALLQKQLFARGDRFIVLSRKMAEELAAQGCPDELIRVVHIGIDPERFECARPRPQDTSQDSDAPCRVLMVGREVEKKGFDDGLRACAKAKARGAILDVTILGTGGELKADLVRLAQELHVEVHWPEPETRVAKQMAQSDVLLVPSRVAKNGDQEGTPTVICEGGASGLAIVATRHAGIPEQVDHDQSGLLCDERDTDALADALLSLSREPVKRYALGAAARQKVQDEFSIRAHRDGVLAVYRELLPTLAETW